MKCPYCEHAESKVIDSRPTDEGNSIRRRRECLKCEKRFTTYEQIESIPVIIIKKDGTRQPYDRQKLMNGILRAIEKTPVTFKEVEETVAKVESKVFNSLDREVESKTIGELVMEELKNLNPVAYVRFASVYREFKDVNVFLEEVKNLLHS
ncbi:MAG: transcriptional regulator NrdR [Ruminococcaceae bacterium]|nr:transcriptional regulator NrdR [Oscillospiraceae bacterium]